MKFRSDPEEDTGDPFYPVRIAWQEPDGNEGISGFEPIYWAKYVARVLKTAWPARRVYLVDDAGGHFDMEEVTLDENP